MARRSSTAWVALALLALALLYAWVRPGDEGPGIPEELREKVFERFYQISQGDTREFSGMGIGLTLTRHIAEAMGGGVEIIDAPEGCQFQMTVPPGKSDWKTNGN